MPPRATSPAAQVDALHLGRVDEDLEQRGGLRHLGHGGRSQLERDRATSRHVDVGPDRRVDDPERVAQDAVLFEGAHGIQVRDGSPRGGRRRSRVTRPRRVEPHLEQPHELLRDGRVRGEGVVLVLDGEGRVHPMVVLAVGAQDLHLSPVDAGGHDQAVERVGLGTRRATPRRCTRRPGRRPPRRRSAGGGCRARRSRAGSVRRRPRPGASSATPRSPAARGIRGSARRSEARPCRRPCTGGRASGSGPHLGLVRQADQEPSSLRSSSSKRATSRLAIAPSVEAW